MDRMNRMVVDAPQRFDAGAWTGVRILSILPGPAV
jgi:hypothetical protein